MGAKHSKMILFFIFLMTLGLAIPLHLGGQERLETEDILESLQRLDQAVFNQQTALEAAQGALENIHLEKEHLLAQKAILSKEMDTRRDRLRGRIRALYKYSGRGFMKAVLGGGGAQASLTRTRYLYYVVKHDMALLEKQKADLARFHSLEDTLEKQQAALGAASAFAEVKQASLEDERRRRFALLEAIRRETSLKERVRQEREVASRHLQAMLAQAQPPSTPRPTATPSHQRDTEPKSTETPFPKAVAPKGTEAPPKATQKRPTETPLPTATQPNPAATQPNPTAIPPNPTPTPTQKSALAEAIATRSTPTAPAPTPTRTATRTATPLPSSSPFERAKGRHLYPTTGKITRAFGRYTVEGMMAPAYSKGLEIQAPNGTPFKAIAPGQVQMADWFKGYGQMIIINHGDDYRSIYTHASRLLVKVGDTVERGDVIGLVGDTGSLKGPYLYLEMRHGKSPINPMSWLKIPPGKVDLH